MDPVKNQEMEEQRVKVPEGGQVAQVPMSPPGLGLTPEQVRQIENALLALASQGRDLASSLVTERPSQSSYNVRKYARSLYRSMLVLLLENEKGLAE